MGCFSFICKKSGKSIATASKGDACRLYLLKDGIVIEEMRGHYDSYGRVFDNKGKSFCWNTSWPTVCDLIDSDNKSDGIAAILECYFDGEIPTEQSDRDPYQGTGKRNGKRVSIKDPYHKIYATIESVKRDSRIGNIIDNKN